MALLTTSDKEKLFDQTKTYWFDDIGTVVAFVRWYLDESIESWRCATDIFEMPWLWDEDYQGYVQWLGVEDLEAERFYLSLSPKKG